MGVAVGAAVVTSMGGTIGGVVEGVGFGEVAGGGGGVSVHARDRFCLSCSSCDSRIWSKRLERWSGVEGGGVGVGVRASDRC